MLLEQCRPLNVGRVSVTGLLSSGNKNGPVPFDGSRSAGTTSPEAAQGRVRRFVRTGSPRKLEGARFTRSGARSSEDLAIPGRGQEEGEKVFGPLDSPKGVVFLKRGLIL